MASDNSTLLPKETANFLSPADLLPGPVERITIKLATSAFDKYRVWKQGHLLLLLGPPRSGKTSFYQYLRFESLQDANQTVAETVDHDDSESSFIVTIGASGKLSLPVRYLIDSSGHSGPFDHASLIAKHRKTWVQHPNAKRGRWMINKKPFVPVIFLSAISPRSDSFESYKGWIERFSFLLGNMVLRHRNLNDLIRSIVVVVNKIDRVDKKKYDQVQKDVQSAFSDKLKPFLGNRVDNFPILPCALINGYGGKDDDRRLVNNVIKTIILQLK